MKLGFILMAFHLALLASGTAFAQCANAARPSCNVYETCFATYCPCKDDPSEYFLTYGKRYCTSFLANTDLGPAGRKWRDATLTCLQEKIVPHLDISAAPTCDCQKMRSIAFDSHVACYTQTQASICDLPMADLKAIVGTIDKKDLFTADGWRQMARVAAICVGKAPDPARREEWSKARAKLP